MQDMSAIEQLPATLNRISQVALARMRLGDSLQIKDERSKLEAWLGGVAETEEQTGDRILSALQSFYESRVFRGPRQARLICYGCAQPFDAQPHPVRLIENPELFIALLDYVDTYSHRIRIFRKCYRGLLNCYFSYNPYSDDATAEGRLNWEALRKFLQGRMDNLKTKGYNPGWIAALSDHADLLAEYPCERYGAAALDGDWSAADEIRLRLEIADDSWLIQRLIITQIKAMLAQDDQPFKELIDHALLLLSQHRLYAGAGLKRLLDRYAKCADREVNAPLRDFAMSVWGNPWLPRNAHLWQCRPGARKMVADWLKRHLLNEFFLTISGGDGDNPRRLNFWELYCDDLQGMYFALGRDAFVSGNKSLYRFRRNAKGLIVRLTDAAPGLHALILQFERHHVVEFNRHNNVSYFYDTQHGIPPFYFGKGWVEVGALSVGNVLKGSSVSTQSKPLRHQDINQLAWEGEFAREMGATENSIKEFCRKYQCRYKDLRSQDGHQWIRPTNQMQCAHDAASVLWGWGFAWSADEKAYFRRQEM